MRERLALPNFSQAKVAKHGDIWLYRYKYSAEPKHEVAISVYRDGNTEVSRMFDEVVDKGAVQRAR